MLWEDGKGSGRKAGVDIRNFGQVTAVIIDDDVHVALNENSGYSVDTGIITAANIGVSASDLTVITLKNLEGARDILAKVTVTIDLPSAGAAFSVFRNPVESADPLAESAAKTPLNVNYESGKNAFVQSFIWDQTTPGAGIGDITAVTDGTFGPFMLGSPEVVTGRVILGQNDLLTVQLFSGAVAYSANVMLSFYFDTTGAK